MKKIETLALSLILAFGFVVRLYRFDSPIADWHSWRQADTAAVSKIFVEEGFDILHPKYYDISNIQSGRNNPEGYRFVEFPLYNFFQAGAFVLFDFFTLEQWGRLLSIISSTLSTLFIFLLVKKYLNIRVALFSAFFYSFLPFSIYYGRTVLPDTMMVAASLGGIYFFDQAIEKNFIRQLGGLNFKFILAIIFTAAALLLKPFAIFFALPMVYIAWKKFGFRSLTKWEMWLFTVLSIAPLIIWRFWISQYPEGIPGFWWLLNGGDIRFKGAFFYWIFAERLSKLILGYVGIVFFILGFFKKEGEKHYSFFLAFLLSTFTYLAIIARGNVQHDYYQILIIPTVSIFAARGVDFLLSVEGQNNKFVTKSVVAAVIIGMLAFSWFHIRGNYVVNFPVVAAGRAAQAIIPKYGKVIAPQEGDTTLLYHIGRRGWPSFQRPIEELIAMGAEYLILTNPTEKDYEGFGKQYEIVADSNEYLILKLK